jgi:pilus assembly protein CpaE
MTASTMLAVGSPPAFRQTVSRVVAGSVESVDWVPAVTTAEEIIAREGAADVIVVSPGVKEADALGFSEWISRTAPASAVVLVRDHAPSSLISAAMRAGTRDVVDLSRGGDDLREALERAMSWSEKVRGHSARAAAPSGTGTMVAVFSSKGGSGKTFVATSLAVAVARRWEVETAMLDLDLDMGDVYSYYGLEPKLAVNDLLALGDRTDRDDILRAGTPVIDHLWAYGAPPDPAAEVPSGESVGKLLRAMRGRFAFTVVDATAEYSDQALAAFDLSDSILLVAALDVVGVRHLGKALETLQLIGVDRDRIRVVLNRADSKVGLSPQQVERLMHVKVDAMIPSSRLVPTALNKGRPVYIDEPKSEVAMSIDALADLVAGPVLGPAQRPGEATAKRRWFARAPRAKQVPDADPATESAPLYRRQEQEPAEPQIVAPAKRATARPRTAAKRTSGRANGTPHSTTRTRAAAASKR